MAQETEKIETTPPVETATPETTTVETSKVETPVVETPKEDTTDFNEFLAVKGEEAPKVEDKPKEEEKPKEETTKTEDKPKTEVAPAVADKGKLPSSRDYTGIPENVVPLLKKMSNDAFAFFKPVYLENEQLKNTIKEKDAEIVKVKSGALPDSYYEHPLAYALTPEFESKMKEFQDSNAVFNHWSNELQKVRAGATEYTTLTKDKHGNIVLGNKVPADAAAETTLLKYFTFAQNQAARKQGNLEAYQVSFAEKHQATIAEIKGMEDTCFPMFKDEKHPSQPIIIDTYNKFPPTMRNNPLGMILAKSLTANLQLGRIIKSLQDKGVAVNGNPKDDKAATRAAALKKDIKEAGPTKTSGATVVAPSDKEEVTMDDFEAVKQR